VRVVYSDPSGSKTEVVRSILANLTDIEIARRAQLSPSAVRRLRRRKPQPRTLAKLLRVAAEVARENTPVDLPADDASACAAFDALPDSLKNAEHRCQHCGATLQRGRASYCDDPCRQANYRRRRSRGLGGHNRPAQFVAKGQHREMLAILPRYDTPVRRDRA
jgi:transcriptional regulator with XRE-family HTH domain